MNLDDDDNAKPTQFSDSVCICESCNHKIALYCMKANCNCCTNQIILWF